MNNFFLQEKMSLYSRLRVFVQRKQQLEANPRTSALYQQIKQACIAAAQQGLEEYKYTSNDTDVSAGIQTALTEDGLTIVAGTDPGFTYSYTFSWPEAPPPSP